jgi:hypothetical protein
MPMLFHSIVGKDEREGNSPSWFNVQECQQVGNRRHTQRTHHKSASSIVNQLLILQDVTTV